MNWLLCACVSLSWQAASIVGCLHLCLNCFRWQARQAALLLCQSCHALTCVAGGAQLSRSLSAGIHRTLFMQPFICLMYHMCACTFLLSCFASCVHSNPFNPNTAPQLWCFAFVYAAPSNPNPVLRLWCFASCPHANPFNPTAALHLCIFASCVYMPHLLPPPPSLSNQIWHHLTRWLCRAPTRCCSAASPPSSPLA